MVTETDKRKRKGLGEQGRQIVHDTAANWNTTEMLAEVRARVQDQGGEFRSRQATAVLEVCAEQLQSIWGELSRQHDRIMELERQARSGRP